jgi:hypothetical protein
MDLPEEGHAKLFNVRNNKLYVKNSRGGEEALMDMLQFMMVNEPGTELNFAKAQAKDNSINLEILYLVALGFTQLHAQPLYKIIIMIFQKTIITGTITITMKTMFNLDIHAMRSLCLENFQARLRNNIFAMNVAKQLDEIVRVVAQRGRRSVVRHVRLVVKLLELYNDLYVPYFHQDVHRDSDLN